MMNKFLVFYMVSCFLPAVLPAQKQNSGNLLVGFSAGLNASNQELRLKGENEPFLMRAGWRAGIDLEKPVTSRFSLGLSLGYARHGSNDVQLSGDNEVLNYLEATIQAKEYLPSRGSDLYFSIGPYIGYGISGKRVNMEGETVTDDLFSRDEYTRIDWGLAGNFGFKFPWGSFIQMGMKGAFNNCYQTQGLKYYNFALMATVGHSFGWKRHKKQ